MLAVICYNTQVARKEDQREIASLKIELEVHNIMLRVNLLKGCMFLE